MNLSLKQKRSLRNRLSAFNIRMKVRKTEMDLKQEIYDKDEKMQSMLSAVERIFEPEV